MNSFQIALAALVIAMVGQLAAARLFIERFFRERGQARGYWLLLGLGMILPAVDHAYQLELAFEVGLFDLRAAVLGASAAILCLWGSFRLCRPSA